MRAVLVCTLLLAGLSSPVFGQQLKEITNSIGMKLVLIHAGSFAMGSHVEESGRKDRELQHEFSLSKSFYLGVYEVTQGQYGNVIENKPNRFKTNPFPLQNISWEDAVAFCTKLSELPVEKASGRVYRLPTEEEREYACRATSSAAYSFGDSVDLLGDFACFKEGILLGERQAENYQRDETPLRPFRPTLPERESDFTLPPGGSSEARGGYDSVCRSP